MNKKLHTKKVLLYMKIANEIHAEIVQKSLDTIPSVHLLAERYNASPCTVVRAIHLLQENGLLRVSRGKKTVVVKPGGTENGTTNSSIERFAALIRDKIESGVFRNGQVLPKQLSFISTHHVSSNTICTAFEKLRLQQLIHKTGKKWVVGPAESGARGLRTLKTGYTPRVILILMRDYRGWRESTRTNDRVQSFIRELVKELQRYDVQFKFVLHDATSSAHAIFTREKSEILALASSLGGKYTGTLAIGDVSIFPEIADYVSALTTLNKPVVWFNPVTDMQSGSPSMRRHGHYYCMPSHESLAELAIATLYESGHRRIIFPVPCSLAHVTWVRDRMRLLQETALKLNDGISVKRAILNDRIWREETKISEAIMSTAIMSIEDKIRGSAGNGDPATLPAAQLQKNVYSLSPSLGKSIVENNATAIIAPNQSIAVNYYYWLKHSGVSIPEDISMITFDNLFYLSCFPISTIDWKSDDAGYKTAHIFIGVIPVKTGKKRIINHSPAFIDRGSVAAPPRHAIRFG